MSGVAKATTVPRVPRQRYSAWQHVRAVFVGRGLLITEAVIAAAIVAVVVAVNLAYQLQHGARDPLQALAATITFLALQAPAISDGDRSGLVLLLFNVLFSLLFAQSLLNSARVLFRPQTPEARQLGMAAVLRDHIIVCGLGRVGQRIVARLVAAGLPVAVIEHAWESPLVSRALEQRVPVIVGDAREPAALYAAGLRHARAVIACVNDDLLDVEIALAAHNQRPDVRVILRAFNEEFDRGLERSFGPQTAFSTSALAAPTFAAAAVTRGVEHVLPLGDFLLGATQVNLPPGFAPFASVRAFEDAYSVRVLSVERVAPRTPDEAPEALRGDDRLTLLGSLDALAGLWAAGIRDAGQAAAEPSLQPTPQRDTIIICGLGKIGYRVVRRLHGIQPKARLVVIFAEDDKVSFSRQISSLEGVTLVRGDARDAETLARAGLDRALAVAAVTSDDLTNLQIGLEARRHRPDVHIVLRVFSSNLAEKLADLFGIHTAYSTSDLASSTLAAAAVLGGVEHAFSVDGLLYALGWLTVPAGSALRGLTVEAVRKAYGALVVAFGSDGDLRILPPLDATVAPGETLRLVAPLQALARLRDTFG